MRRRLTTAIAVALAATIVWSASALAITWASPVSFGIWGSTAVWPHAIAAAADGTLHLVYAEGVPPSAAGGDVAVQYRRSTDDGRTWSVPMRISGGSDGTRPALSVSGATVDVVFLGEGARYRRSLDSGRTWQKIKRLDFGAGMGATDIDIARGSNGRVYVAAVTDGGYGRLLISTNGGGTFGAPKAIDGGTSISIAASASRVVIMTAASGSARSRASADGGATWKSVPQTSVGDGARPGVAISGSTIVVAFGVVVSGHQHVVTRRSTDGGLTFSPLVIASSASLPPSAGPIIMRTGTTWYLAFERCADVECLGTTAQLTQSTTATSWPASTRVSPSSFRFASPAGLVRTSRTHVVYTGFTSSGVPTAQIRSGQ